MKRKFDNVDCKYGAPMGRPDNVTESDKPIKLHLQKVIIRDGYDNGGAYWGNGPPSLYCAWGYGENELQETFVRAHSRKQAKELVRLEFLNARFYN